MQFDVIYTLEARSHMLLEVVAEHFKQSDAQMFREIQNEHKTLVKVLASKGIQYADLKNALVPTTDRNERAYVFNWIEVGEANYGRVIVERALPAFQPQSTHSVLLGDWIYREDHNAWAIAELKRSLFGVPSAYLGVGHDVYIVYVNNLSDGQAEAMHTAFQGMPACLGYLDLTFASVIKAYISTMLVRAFIKHRKFILQGHEDDRPNNQNVSMLPYGFQDAGYSVRSLQGLLYGAFLSYKIERPVLLRGDTDTRFPLIAMGASHAELDEFEVVLDERRLQYLRSDHLPVLEYAGYVDLSATEIAEQIRRKVKANYIYNLTHFVDGTVKFNIVLESPGLARFRCALKYFSLTRQLEVITLF